MKILLRGYLGILNLVMIIMIIITPLWMWISLVLIGEDHRYVIRKYMDYCYAISQKYELFGQRSKKDGMVFANARKY